MSHQHVPARRPSAPFGMREHKVGDAERTACAEQLGEHFAAGRLDHDEYEARVRGAMVAVTNRDLARLSADLPPLGAPRSAPPVGRILLAGLVSLSAALTATLLAVIGVGMVIANATNWPWLLLFSLVVGIVAVAAAVLTVRDVRAWRSSTTWLRRS